MATIKPILRKRNIISDQYPVYIRLIHDRKMTEVKIIDVVIAEKYWDNKKSKVKTSHPRATVFNQLISSKRQEYENSYYALLKTGKSFHVKDIVKGLETQSEALTLSKYTSQYLEHNPDGLTRGTLQYHRTFINKWNEVFEDILISDVDKNTVQVFLDHLREQGYATNTVHNRMKILRKILFRAVEDGFISKNPMSSFKIPQEKGNREYLTREELSRVERLEYSNELKRLSKDIFLFSCYTGLRISDICTLKGQHLQEEKGSLRMHKRMGKTKEFVSFKLNQKAQDIVELYITDEKQQYVFPMLRKYNIKDEEGEKRVISSQNALMNKVLKDIMREADIDKHISLHCGRHTHAVLSLAMGADLYVLSKILGHTSISTTEIYAKVVDKRKDELTELWNNSKDGSK